MTSWWNVRHNRHQMAECHWYERLQPPISASVFSDLLHVWKTSKPTSDHPSLASIPLHSKMFLNVIGMKHFCIQHRINIDKAERNTTLLCTISHVLHKYPEFWCAMKHFKNNPQKAIYDRRWKRHLSVTEMAACFSMPIRTIPRPHRGRQHRLCQTWFREIRAIRVRKNNSLIAFAFNPIALHSQASWALLSLYRVVL